MGWNCWNVKILWKNQIFANFLVKLVSNSKNKHSGFPWWPHNTFVQVLQRSWCWKWKQRLNTNYGWEGFINMYPGDMRGSQSHQKCTVHPLPWTPFWLNRSFNWAYNQLLPLLHLHRACSLCIGGRIPADSSNVTFGLHSYTDTSDCIVSFFLSPTPKPMYDMIWCFSRVQSDLVVFICTIWSWGWILVFPVRYQSPSHRYYDT